MHFFRKMADSMETEDIWIKEECLPGDNVKVELTEGDTPLEFNIDGKTDFIEGTPNLVIC